MYQNEINKPKKKKAWGNLPTSYNDKDYTQDFIKMGENAKNNPQLQKQLYNTQREKEQYMRKTNFPPLIQMASKNNQHAEKQYYQNLEDQKVADPERYQENSLVEGAKALENPETPAEEAAPKRDYSRYVTDYQHRINTTNDPSTVAGDLQARQEKMDFMANNDIQALINAETDPVQRAHLEKVRENKLSTMGDDTVTPQSLYGQAAALVGDNTGRVDAMYARAGNQIKGYADNYEKWAEGQLQAAEKKAQGDADRAVKDLYADYYQNDLPELERQMARMGGASASGFSRQEALLAQQGLLEEKNDILAEKSRTIADAQNQARELISQGRVEEGKLLAQLAEEQAAAVQNQLNLDKENTVEHFSVLNDNEQTKKQQQWETSENQADRAHQSSENDKKIAADRAEGEEERKHEITMQDKQNAHQINQQAGDILQDLIGTLFPGKDRVELQSILHQLKGEDLSKLYSTIQAILKR